ncbi:hypothetical protein NC653_028697 [Populus alba x Populus x berolinensis]|uniref:Uncharacterized protein n=1 Tax=Populus alba x Populus x berolinensis TaxID=444605 RepID=A0AAD6M0F8_9ROSI|nr:hypothetical protein NC653_028697 [Populus alba x Populus x berolinensis]
MVFEHPARLHVIGMPRITIPKKIPGQRCRQNQETMKEKKRKEAKLCWQGCRLYDSTRAWGGDIRSRT